MIALGGGARKAGKERLQRHTGTSGSNGYSHYLDCNDGFTDTHIGQNSMKDTL